MSFFRENSIFVLISVLATGFGVSCARLPGMAKNPRGLLLYQKSGAVAPGADGNTDCHLEAFRAKVIPTLQTQCLTCHGNSGFGTLMISASDADLPKVLRFVAADSAHAEDTTFVRMISADSSLAHSVKLTSGDPDLADITDWVGQYLLDPDCSKSVAPAPDATPAAETNSDSTV